MLIKEQETICLLLSHIHLCISVLGSALGYGPQNPRGIPLMTIFLEAALENEQHRREERGVADPNLLQLLSSQGNPGTTQAFLSWLH